MKTDEGNILVFIFLWVVSILVSLIIYSMNTSNERVLGWKLLRPCLEQGYTESYCYDALYQDVTHFTPITALPIEPVQ